MPAEIRPPVKPAIPLTADQAHNLVAMLHETDRIARAHRLAAGSNGRYARLLANAVSERAGAALAGGMSFVPQPVHELDGYDRLLVMMATLDPGNEQLPAFQALITVMRTLRGMGAVHDWRVRDLRGVLVWVEDPRIGRETTSDMRVPSPVGEVERS